MIVFFHTQHKQETMELKSCSPVATFDCISDLGVSRYLRDMPPAHYTLTIGSYSKFLKTLSNNGLTRCLSQKFKAAGYKWKLCLYPSGDEERNGKGYISMFLIIKDTESLPLGWKVNVIYKFFVLDQIRNKYLSIQEAYGRISQFDAKKKEWGISQLIPHVDFHNTEKGFLIRDKCIFGAEICVIHGTHAGEKIAFAKNFELYTYKWEVAPFSANTKQIYHSGIFTAGNFKWKLSYCPKGCRSGKGNSLSVCLNLVDIKASERVYVEYKVCIHDQRSSSKHHQKETRYWFKASSTTDWSSKFLSLSDLYDRSKGFVVKDKVIFEVQITNIFIRKRLIQTSA